MALELIILDDGDHSLLVEVMTDISNSSGNGGGESHA